MNLFLQFAQDLAFFNVIAIPLYISYRVYRNIYSLLNPSLHLLILSYLYFTISSLFLDHYINFMRNTEPWFTTFSDESIEITSLLCNWFTIVFLGWYFFSKDPRNVNLSFFPQKITYQLSVIITVIITSFFAIILLTQGSEIIATANRHDALEFFANEILNKYKYPYLLNILMACLAVITWRKANFKWYLVLIIPVITELLSQGRDLSFFVLVFAYINYVAVTRQLRLGILFILAFGLLSTVFFRLGGSGFGQKIDYLIYLFGEIFATRLTTIISYDYFLNAGDLGSYLLYSILNILPAPITRFWIDAPTNYVYFLKDFYEHKLVYSRTGLAGNMVSEALYYGGIAFALITPFIIGFIFWSLNQLKIYKTFPGFLYYCFLISKLRSFIRIGFYDSFLSLLTLMFTLMLWIILLEYKNKRVNVKLSHYKTTYQ